jgi:uncharacterized protein (DUF2062 family)
MVRFPRVRRWLEQLLHTHDTPGRTAFAYALGVFFGFSPFLGLHTVLGITFAFALNLNRVAVLLGVYSSPTTPSPRGSAPPSSVSRFRLGSSKR